MNTPSLDVDSLALLPYQRALRDFLQASDPEVWRWITAKRATAAYAEEVRFDLLKSTYRIDRGTQPALYAAAEEVAAALGIDAPVTLYQSQNPEGHNAALAYVPGEIHIVLQGPICERLTPAETRCLFGHELGHYRLWSDRDGELLAVSDMLASLTNMLRPHAAHLASLRLLQLYNETYCDRCSFAVTGDLQAVVSMLVKATTGVGEVSAEAYLRQADEIFARESASTTGLTHPEAFIRARAVRLWSEQAPDCDAVVARMIEGNPGIDDLDLLEQTRVARFTRRIFDRLLGHAWFQTSLVLAHARLFFDDYEFPTMPVDDPALAREIRLSPDSLRDYYIFVLLDLLSADRDQDEPAVAAALRLVEELGVKERFVELARQELKLRKTHLEKTDRTKDQILADADRAAATRQESP